MTAHANRRGFTGVLARLDEPSDKPPSGAEDPNNNGVLHRIILPSRVAEAALDTLIGMAVNYNPARGGHDMNRIIGIITDAGIKGKNLLVSGYVFSRNYQEEMDSLGREDLGMSYEMAAAHVADMSASIWTLTRTTFTGAAILPKSRAAYKRTSFKLEEAYAPSPVSLAAQSGTELR